MNFQRKQNELIERIKNQSENLKESFEAYDNLCDDLIHENNQIDDLKDEIHALKQENFLLRSHFPISNPLAK